jgi:hypothetical protein
MKIRIDVTPDSVGQVIEDLTYVNSLIENNKSEILSPFTMQLLQNIVTAAEEKAVYMVEEGSKFSEVFEEQREELEKSFGKEAINLKEGEGNGGKCE